MTLEEGPIEDVRSLASLAEDLQANRPTSRDPRLQQLETAVRDLLSAIERLHEHNWSIGLLQPGNVLVNPRSMPTILLPDLGFVWGEDSLLVPDWTKVRFAFLWDRPPAQQQALTQTQGPDRRADVATVARLISWVLTGREQRIVTPPLPGPTSSGKQLRRSARWNQLWDILWRASRGEIESSAELRQALEDVPLRTHFATQGMRVWVKIVAMGVLFLAIFGGAYFSGMLTGPKAPPVSRTGDGSLAKFQQMLEQWKKEFATAPMPRQAAIVVEVSRAAPNPEIGQQETDLLREQALAAWQERCRVAANRISQEQSLDNFRQLGGLYQDLIHYQEQIKTLPPSPPLEEKERQCLAYIKEQLE
jgi:hypothetical protein